MAADAWQTLDRSKTSAAVGVGENLSAGIDRAFDDAVYIEAPDPYAGSAPKTRKPRFWGRF